MKNREGPQTACLISGGRRNSDAMVRALAIQVSHPWNNARPGLANSRQTGYLLDHVLANKLYLTRLPLFWQMVRYWCALLRNPFETNNTVPGFTRVAVYVVRLVLPSPG
jgi:hypothetical protein